MTTLVLTGFMGTGKTTVGRILADRFGLELVDTDTEVERRTGGTVRELFATGGEEAFRRREAEVVCEAMQRRGVIVATGGGTLLDPKNRALLGDDHHALCLTANLTEIEQRIGTDDGRPLLAGRSRDNTAALLGTRAPSYARFEQIDTSGRSPGEVAGEIGARLNLAAMRLTFDSSRTTTIHFERGVFKNAGTLLRDSLLRGPVLAVTDENVVNALGREAVLDTLGCETYLTVLPAGEEHKTLESVRQMYRDCLAHGLDRSSSVIGIGGGVIGDIAGFAASTYMRGVALGLVPTTLLAQVDAAIGGKVAADLDGVKNLVGTFYPARLVVIDPDLLATLSDAALADGLAEVVKIGAILDAELLEAVEMLGEPRDTLARSSIIRRAVELKMRIVETDPYDRGERALLNFGHTIGHAIEAASGFRLSHGQSISVGMIAETWLAERLGISDGSLRCRLQTVLNRLGLPLHAPGLDIDTAVLAMAGDKKRRGDEFWFALATEAGNGCLLNVPASDARAAVQYAVGGGG